VPSGILEYREKILEKRRKKLNIKRSMQEEDIVEYFRNMDKRNIQNEEIKEVIDYFTNNQFSVFPYEFIKKYHADNVMVYYNKAYKMRYVMHENKRMYFPKPWEENRIKSYYNWLLIEQDINSPHRYKTSNFHVDEGDIIADIGASEGMFALSNAEKAKKIYLFECDETWVDALQKTFEPWNEKTTIVNKYISNNSYGNNITFDDFLNGSEINFIKADIEGAEISLLKGAKKMLVSQKKLKIILCTYHRQNDAETLNNILKQNNYDTEFSKGYMIFTLRNNNYKKPYLRRGLIRAIKKEAP
jgi:hypothetical protein